jgi:hypothetical protein
LLEALGAAREGREHLQPLGKVANRLEMSRALDSTLACPLPIRHRLDTHAGLGVVMGQELGLRLAEIRKLRFHHLRNALMVLLACTPQQ